MAHVQAGKVRLEYFDIGDGERAVVLVHGASSGRIWHAVQQSLAGEGFRSIAVSLLGAGSSDRSDRPEDYHPSSYAADLANTVDALELPTFTLVGHSLGTIVAAYYLRDHADRVETLVQMSGPPIITPAARPRRAVGRAPASRRRRCRAVAPLSPTFPALVSAL